MENKCSNNKRICLCSSNGKCIIDGTECDGKDLNKENCEMSNIVDAKVL